MFMPVIRNHCILHAAKHSAIAILLLAVLIAPALADEPAASPSQQPEYQLESPSGLMVDLKATPQGEEWVDISDTRPEFSWIVGGCENENIKAETMQSAYRIQVFDREQEMISQDSAVIETRCIWDSGRVESTKSVAVQYDGPELKVGKEYIWSVQIWDQNGKASLASRQIFRVVPAESPYTVQRYLLRQVFEKPVRIVDKGDGHYFIDFGRAAYGTLAFKNAKLPEGETIEVHLGEKATADDTVDREPGGTVRYRKVSLTTDGSEEQVVVIPPDTRNTGPAAIKMPDYTGEVMPFRYAELYNVPVKLTDENIQRLSTYYPYDDSHPRFISSDSRLKEIWDFCKYSMKMTSFCGVYVDGDRERIPYEADAYINQLSYYAVAREYTLARYSHEYLLRHPTWPTEWQPHSVLIAWADYMQTGDPDSMAAFYDDLKAKTLYQLAREDGLISTQTGLYTPEVADAIHLDRPIRDIVDWPAGERDGYEMAEVNTVVNAFHYRSLVIMKQIAAALDKTDDEKFFAGQAEKVYKTFNEKLFDKEQGLYIDGEGSKHASQHANMWALAFGLVPSDRVEKVARFVKSRGMACSVYGAQYLLEGLYAADMPEMDQHALDLMLSDSDRGWLHMIHDVGTTVTLEAWDAKYKPNLDWNHAWGAAPGNIIARYVMGITPLEPGFAKVRIRPQPGDLKSAAIFLPTIRGDIEVQFQSRDGSFGLICNLPGNTTAEVCYPLADDLDIAEDAKTVTLQLDGKPIEAKHIGRWAVIDNVMPGSHSIMLPQ